MRCRGKKVTSEGEGCSGARDLARTVKELLVDLCCLTGAEEEGKAGTRYRYFVVDKRLACDSDILMVRSILRNIHR